MESGLTHIQGLLQLSDNVGMSYPKNKSVLSIGPHWYPGKLECYKHLLSIYVPNNGMEWNFFA